MSANINYIFLIFILLQSLQFYKVYLVKSIGKISCYGSHDYFKSKLHKYNYRTLFYSNDPSFQNYKVMKWEKMIQNLNSFGSVGLVFSDFRETHRHHLPLISSTLIE